MSSLKRVCGGPRNCGSTPWRNSRPVIARRRQVFFERWYCDTPVHDRDSLAMGTRLDGPAVIEEMGATTLLHPGQTLQVEAGGLLVVVKA